MPELEFITCVEDDEDIRAIVELALVDIGGLSVQLFDSGVSAVNNIEPEKAQLVMLDVMMPGMDGMETLEKLRQNPELAATPVIFMTAKAQPNELSSFKAAGAVDVITKPFDPMTLADQVKEIWIRAVATAD